MSTTQRILSMDLETHSPVDLQTAGAFKYFEHPATDVLCAVYHPVGEDAPPRLWRRGEPPPEELCWYLRNGAIFSGWNVMFFDRIGWRSVMVQRYGFPEISDDNWRDSMQLAAAANLPRSLDACAGAVGVPYEKNLKDNANIRRITDAKRTPVPTAEDLDWLERRCIQDVIMEEGVLLRLPGWPQMAPWLHLPAVDRRINDRGVLVDLELVRGMSRAAASETRRLNGVLSTLTGGKVPKTTNIEGLKTWLLERGVELPRNGTAEAEEDADVGEDEETETTRKSPWRLRKTDIADLLARSDVPDDCRQALSIRAEAGKASVRKLNSIEAYANADGHIRGLLKLGGAQQTMRWSSGGPQFHNLLRDAFGNPDEIADLNGLDVKKQKAEVLRLQNMALTTAIQLGCEGDADVLRAVYERHVKDAQGRVSIAGVLTWVARMLRRTIAAPRGMVLLNGDYSSAQARITAWLSQQTDMLGAYFRNEDTYKVSASGIYHVPIEALTKLQRQAGKVTILAGGFGGGAKALLAMAYNYGMLLSLEEATTIIKAWRLANQQTASYWFATDDAAAMAVQNRGMEFFVPPCGLVSYFMDPDNDCLCCRLPSGRVLRYWAPRLSQEHWADGRPKDRLSLTCLTVKGGAVFRASAYHTILVNNQVQGIEADMLADALVNLENAGLPVSLHVHDNAAAPVPEDKAEDLLPVFRQCLLDMRPWTKGLPVAAEVEAGARFA